MTESHFHYFDGTRNGAKPRAPGASTSQATLIPPSDLAGPTHSDRWPIPYSVALIISLSLGLWGLIALAVQAAWWIA